jgi:hypothetical protein
MFFIVALLAWAMECSWKWIVFWLVLGLLNLEGKGT